MKIYEYTLLPNEQAYFYVRDGYLTHVNDRLYPFNFSANLYWEPDNISRHISKDYIPMVECYLVKIKKKNFVAYSKIQIEILLDITAICKNPIIVVRRDLNEEEMECAWFHFNAITNSELQENLMEAFW